MHIFYNAFFSSFFSIFLHSREDKNFNREVFVDFMSAQVRTLSFLAYITRIYQEVVMKNHKLMVEGMLSMLRLCPKEVTSLRRDLFIASRHILSTDLRVSKQFHNEGLEDSYISLSLKCICV